MTKPGGQKGRRAKRGALVALAVAAGVVLFVASFVLPALRAIEAERQRSIRETPNYGYDPGVWVTELEAAKLAAGVEQERRRAAEAELARLNAEQARRPARRYRSYEEYLSSQICMTGPLPVRRRGSPLTNPCKPLSREEWEWQHNPNKQELPRRKASGDDDPLAGLGSLVDKEVDTPKPKAERETRDEGVVDTSPEGQKGEP